MAGDLIKFVQAQSFTLAGAGAVLGETEVTLASFAGIDGTLLTMADFGDKGFCTVEPNTGMQEEQIVFTGVTQNANGMATLTGISSVLFIAPYTETVGFVKSHPGGVKLVVTNTSGFYNTFVNKNDDETITGVWTFTQPNYPRMDNVFVFPTDPEQLVPKAYADSLTFAGAPNASTSVQGLVQEATVGQVNAGTSIGSTGAVLFASPADLTASIYGLQLPTSGQKDALAGNSGTPSSSNRYITELGNRTMTSFSATRLSDTASGSQVIAHGFGKAPTYAKFTATWLIGGASTDTCISTGTSNNVGVFTAFKTTANQFYTSFMNAAIEITETSVANTQVATVASMDATNITLTWVKTGTLPGTSASMNILIEIFG